MRSIPTLRHSPADPTKAPVSPSYPRTWLVPVLTRRSGFAASTDGARTPLARTRIRQTVTRRACASRRPESIGQSGDDVSYRAGQSVRRVRYASGPVRHRTFLDLVSRRG